MTPLSDQEFKQFYIDNFPKVQTFIFAKCGDLELAEDLAQEAFIRYWQNYMTIEPQKARSFLFTVSNNLFLDNIRHAKVKNNYSKAFQQVFNNQDPQYLIEMEEFKHRLDTTLQKMSEAVREVFLLNRIEKMTYAQIADSLGLSVKAIEKRMQKALEIFSDLKKSIID